MMTEIAGQGDDCGRKGTAQEARKFGSVALFTGLAALSILPYATYSAPSQEVRAILALFFYCL